MIRKPISRRGYLLLGVASVLILTGIYAYLSHSRHQANPLDTAIPSFSQIWEGIQRASTEDKIRVADGEDEWKETWLWHDVKATYARLLSGLGVAAIVSIIIGILMGVYTPIEALLLPPLSFLAKIPPTAMLPIFLVLFGDDFWGFTAILGFGIAPTLAQTVYSAAKKDVPDELLYKAHTLGASQIECIWNVIFKQILPRILEAIRLQVGPAMVYLIAAEALLADAGFGYRIRIQGRLLDMSVVFFYLGVLAVSGYAIDQILIRLRRFLCPWYAA